MRNIDAQLERELRTGQLAFKDLLDPERGLIWMSLRPGDSGTPQLRQQRLRGNELDESLFTLKEMLRIRYESHDGWLSCNEHTLTLVGYDNSWGNFEDVKADCDYIFRIEGHVLLLIGFAEVVRFNQPSEWIDVANDFIAHSLLAW